MKTAPWLPAILLLVVAAPPVSADDNAKLAGGNGWQVVKSEEAPPGTRIQFAADGKLTVTFLVDGKERQVNGSYSLAGNQLTLKLSHDGRERVETRTVKKLTESALVTEDKNRKLEELQRLP